MANKSINELIAAQQVNPGDLFVLEQSGTAKKLTGQILENWLVSFANGHGGIQKIEKTASAGTDPVVDTYTITLADTTTYSFTVTNGQKGDTGEASYIWIKYSSTNPTSNADMYDTPDNWMGIYVGMDATAPADYTAYKWFQIKGAKGDTGDAAAIKSQKVEYASSTSGTVPPDTWGASIPTVPQGNYLWTRITVEFNTGSPVVFYSAARMGIDGTGTVASVAGVAPDQSGNVTLTAADVGAASKADMQVYFTPFADDSPAARFGGTWTQIKDRFILAAGDVYAAGSTGGSANEKITTAQMPEHFHEYGHGFITAASQISGTGNDGITVNAGTYSPKEIYRTKVTGGGEPHNNMPPYLSLYIWMRVTEEVAA